MLPTFQWTTFDVTAMLPPRWRQGVLEIAAEAEFRDFPVTPVISREATGVRHITRGRVHAGQVARGLPWLHQLYRSDFRELAERVIGGPVAPAHDERYGAVLNVQRGTRMRFECHVDSNPLTGLLFCTDHNLAAGRRTGLRSQPGGQKQSRHRPVLLGDTFAVRAYDLL